MSRQQPPYAGASHGGTPSGQSYHDAYMQQQQQSAAYQQYQQYYAQHGQQQQQQAYQQQHPPQHQQHGYASVPYTQHPQQPSYPQSYPQSTPSQYVQQQPTARGGYSSSQYLAPSYPPQQRGGYTGGGYSQQGYNSDGRDYYQQPQSSRGGYQQQQQAYQQAGYSRGGGYPSYNRGGGGAYRGGGRGSGAPGHFGGKELNFVIHVADFDALNVLGRATDIFAALHPNTQNKINRALRGAPEFHLLLLVQGRYLGGFAKRSDRQKCILPQDTSLRFADVRFIATDQGTPFFGSTTDGDMIPRHFYLALRQMVLDVQSMFSHTLLTSSGDGSALDHGNHVQPLTVASDSELLGMQRDDVIAQLTVSSSVVDAVLRIIDTSEGNEQHALFVDGLLGTNAHFLFTSSGMAILQRILGVPSLRRLLFGKLRAAIDLHKSAAGRSADGSAAGDAADNLVGSEGYGLFKHFMIHALSAPLALQVFDALPISHWRGAAPRSKDQIAAEVSVFCSGLELYGFEAVCGNLGGATLAALLGQYRQVAAPQQPDNGDSRKRARDDDAASEPRANDCAATAIEPQYMNRLLCACSAAFSSGIHTESHAVRISALARHVLACRTVQCIIPGFLNAAATAGKEVVRDGTETHGARCLSFVQALCNNAGALMLDNYGNYVMQTLVSETALAISRERTAFLNRSSVDDNAEDASLVLVGLLKRLQEVFEATLLEVASSKCGSNCVEQFIKATAKLPRDIGDSALLSLSDCLLKLGDQTFQQLATHAFGNYVVRQLLQRLSAIAMSNETGASALTHAKRNEKLLFGLIMRSMGSMEHNVYATGIRGWFSQHAARINATAIL